MADEKAVAALLETAGKDPEVNKLKEQMAKLNSDFIEDMRRPPVNQQTVENTYTKKEPVIRNELAQALRKEDRNASPFDIREAVVRIEESLASYIHPEKNVDIRTQGDISQQIRSDRVDFDVIKAAGPAATPNSQARSGRNR